MSKSVPPVFSYDIIPVEKRDVLSLSTTGIPIIPYDMVNISSYERLHLTISYPYIFEFCGIFTLNVTPIIVNHQPSMFESCQTGFGYSAYRFNCESYTDYGTIISAIHYTEDFVPLSL